MLPVNRNRKPADAPPGLARRIARRVWPKRASSLTTPLAIGLLPVSLALVIVIAGQAVHSQGPTRTVEKTAAERAPRPAVLEDPDGYVALEIADPTGPASTRDPAALGDNALSPMAAEMRRVMQMERDGLRRLHERFQRTTDHHAALAIQREIEALKADTELELLRIQADHARREGRVEAAERIENVIDRILNPAVPKTSTDIRQPRPAHDEPRGQEKE